MRSGKQQTVETKRVYDYTCPAWRCPARGWGGLGLTELCGTQYLSQKAPYPKRKGTYTTFANVVLKLSINFIDTFSELGPDAL